MIHARDAGMLESNVALENAAAIGATVAWIIDDGAGATLGGELICREATKIGKFEWVEGDDAGPDILVNLEKLDWRKPFCRGVSCRCHSRSHDGSH